jgi:hypothetical protein
VLYSAKPGSAITRRYTCEACGKLLRLKHDGRPPKFCSNKCRSKARRARDFENFVTGRYHGANRDTKLKNTATKSVACKGDFGDRASLDWRAVAGAQIGQRLPLRARRSGLGHGRRRPHQRGPLA